MAADFEKQSYWHSRFAQEESFEWLTSSATFLRFIKPHLTAAAPSTRRRILHLGSGTSDLHTHLRAEGHDDVTNVDYEPLALARGREIEARVFGDVRTRYVVADVTRLSAACADLSPGPGPGRGEFDLVVDKSTVDAVSCGGEAALLDMARGVRGCLAPGGVWVSLSYSSGRFQLDELPFEVSVVGKIPTPKAKVTDPDVYYWVYLLRPR
ncbi:S-adenosyl-L-methionine-dependent methyltransferase [Xylaria longipes]|nr:S-adenosyl-L-methionine-dependent methyltransferase [Xylaria longipes]